MCASYTLAQDGSRLLALGAERLSAVRYLIDLAVRLGFITQEGAVDLGSDYERLVAHLLALAKSLESLDRH